MRNFTAFIIAALFACASFSSHAQSGQNRCAAEDEFQAQAEKNPQLLQARENLERFTAEYVASHPSPASRTEMAPRIIPVVVHVIHDCGGENISKAQILDQIRILNLDFRKLNADASKVPAAFQPYAADANIEFRLAQKDPSGNCTDGIVRVRSYLTNSCVPRDRVKALSYWDSKKYLNIWIVKSIDAQGKTGTILGYAQFPGGAATTDGVVIRSDYFGSIGTAAGSGYAGRTATHEIGHWLNLRHIWGDAQCGDDLVSDTPTQYSENYGCLTFPHPSNCSGNGANGDMFMNYMDYSNGNCVNMFTTGQVSRMDAILNSATYRYNIWQNSNLVATGTDVTTTTTCAPIPAYCTTTDEICAGDSVSFTGSAYNADVISTYSWSFPGGSPASSTSANPTVGYSTPGTYNVTLTTGNTAGSNSKTFTAAVTVRNSVGAVAGPYVDDFENASTFPGVDGYIENPDNSIYKWERITTATVPTLVAASGTSCLRIRNSSSAPTGEIDSWITPSFDLSNYTNCKLTFKIAYAQYTTTKTDALKVYYSTSCGKSWSLRYTKSASGLATTTSLINSFVPTSAAQWRQEAPSVATFVNGKPNVRFKFEFTSGSDNTLYLDDINISGDAVGINETTAQNLEFQIIPNPAKGSTFISFNTYQNSAVEVTIHDIIGQQLKTLVNADLGSGVHGYFLDLSGFNSGIYFIRLKAGQAVTTQKLVVN